MNTRICHWPLLAMLALLTMLASTTASAEEKAASGATAGTVADSWIMWPKAGEEAQFETALKQHAAWRKSAGEGFVWGIYQPIVGKDLTFYVVRSNSHTWKDFDTQDAWDKKVGASKEFQKSVGVHVARMEHYFSETDTKHSHWIPSEDYKYFGVDSYATKSGSNGERADALNKIQKAAVDAKWPYAYQISNTIGGDGGLNIIVPMKSYADMADADPSLMKVLAKSLGSDAAAAATMKQFSSTVESSDYTVYAYRPDLSTQE